VDIRARRILVSRRDEGDLPKPNDDFQDKHHTSDPHSHHGNLAMMD